MTEVSEAAIEKATGQTWQAWFERLEEHGARDLAHKEIATWLVNEQKVAGWWAQSLTVRYEREIGRRQTGQDNKGNFSASASKTLSGSIDDAMQWWLKKVEATDAFHGIDIVTSSTTSTEKWRHYRAGLADGSRVVVGIYAKTPTKAGLGLQHEKITSGAMAELWRVYWKQFLGEE